MLIQAKVVMDVIVANEVFYENIICKGFVIRIYDTHTRTGLEITAVNLFQMI